MCRYSADCFFIRFVAYFVEKFDAETKEEKRKKESNTNNNQKKRIYLSNGEHPCWNGVMRSLSVHRRLS